MAGRGGVPGGRPGARRLRRRPGTADTVPGHVRRRDARPPRGLSMAFTAAARHEVPGGDQPPEPDARGSTRLPRVDSRRADRVGGPWDPAWTAREGGWRSVRLPGWASTRCRARWDLAAALDHRTSPPRRGRGRLGGRPDGHREPTGHPGCRTPGRLPEDPPSTAPRLTAGTRAGVLGDEQRRPKGYRSDIGLLGEQTWDWAVLGSARRVGGDRSAMAGAVAGPVAVGLASAPGLLVDDVVLQGSRLAGRAARTAAETPSGARRPPPLWLATARLRRETHRDRCCGRRRRCSIRIPAELIAACGRTTGTPRSTYVGSRASVPGTNGSPSGSRAPSTG